MAIMAVGSMVPQYYSTPNASWVQLKYYIFTKTMHYHAIQVMVNYTRLHKQIPLCYMHDMTKKCYHD